MILSLTIQYVINSEQILCEYLHSGYNSARHNMEQGQISSQVLLEYKAKLEQPNLSPADMLQIVKRVRMSLCKEQYKQQLQSIIGSGIHLTIYFLMTKVLTHYIQHHPKDQPLPKDIQNIIYESLWTFTNLSLDQSGQCKHFMNMGLFQVTEETLKMLSYHNIVECTLQLIANLAGQHSRDIKMAYLKSSSVREFLTNHYFTIWKYKNTGAENITYVIANCFRGLNKMNLSGPQIQELLTFYLPIINNMMYLPCLTPQTHLNLYQALIYMTLDWDLYYPEIHAMLKDSFDHANDSIRKAIVEVYGNMAAQSEFGVKVLIEHPSLLPFILNKLKTPNAKSQQKKYMKVCGWVLSNILAGTEAQIDYLLMNYSTFFNQLYEILNINTKLQVLKELVWAICNMIQSCSLSAFEMLYSSNILACLAQKMIHLLSTHSGHGNLGQIYLEGIESYIQRNVAHPDHFGLLSQHKVVILESLQAMRQEFEDQPRRIRVGNAIAYFESIIMAGQLNALNIA